MTVALGISWFSYVCWAGNSCDVCWFVMSLNLYFGFSAAARLAQLGERRSAEREAVGSNPGQTNTQGL